MVKYTLIIEYLSKENNFSQVATLEQVSSYIGYLFGQYQPYMWWVLLATESVTKGKLKQNEVQNGQIINVSLYVLLNKGEVYIP